GNDLRQAPHLPDHHIPLRHKSVLAQIDAGEKICHGSDTSHADALATHFLDPLDLRLSYREHQYSIDGDRYVNGIGACKLRVDSRGAADLGNVDAAADQRLHRARTGGDIHQLDVETVA